jgi:hypothetical protein
MADWDIFEIFPMEQGAGTSRRMSFRVAVRMYNVPLGAEEKDPICLTADADTPEEFDLHIDELITELQKLKAAARSKWANLETKELAR